MTEKRLFPMNRKKNKVHPENVRLVMNYIDRLHELFPEKDYGVLHPRSQARPGFVLDNEGTFTGQVYGLSVLANSRFDGRGGKRGSYELAQPLFDLCADEGIEVLANEEGNPVMTVDRLSGDTHTFHLDLGFIAGNPFGIPALPQGLCGLFLDGNNGNHPWYDQDTMWCGEGLIPYVPEKKGVKK